MDKENTICTFSVYYLALTVKEILSNATTGKNLEDIMLSEMNQSQKDKHSIISLVWGI